MLKAENVQLEFTDEAIREIARVAFEVYIHYNINSYNADDTSLTCFFIISSLPPFHMKANKSVENIGARRLHTIIEKIVEEISFDAPDKAGQVVEVNKDYVTTRVGELLGNADLRRFIL